MGFNEKKSSQDNGDRDSGYAPPPYEQSPSSPTSSTSAGRTIRFPTKFIYNYRWVSTSYLGPTKEEPLFAVKTPSKMVCWRRKDIFLHNGTDKLDAPIASVGPEKGSKCRRSLIRIAPKPGMPKDSTLEVSMSGDNSSSHPFTLPLDNGQVERFEWRQTRGEEVKQLGGGHTSGWKLVRLDGPVVAPGDTSNGWGYTSDGKEVVALAAHPRWFKSNPSFSFMGTGATGQLGETFEIVAVMGFLRLYEIYMDQMAAAGAASSSSSGAAAAVAASG